MDKGNELFKYQEGTSKTRQELAIMTARRIINPILGYGFLNQSQSTINLLAEIGDMPSGWQNIKWQDDFRKMQSEINENTVNLVISGRGQIDQKTYNAILSLRRNHNKKFGEFANLKVLVIADNFPETTFFGDGTRSYVIEETPKGFNLMEYNLAFNEKGERDWIKNKPMLFYYKKPSTTEQIMMARQLARSRKKKLTEHNLWTEFQNGPRSYDNAFKPAFRDTIEQYVEYIKRETGSVYVLDAFSDPSMIRILSKENRLDGGVAIGLLDTRSEEEKTQDQAANILYIAKAETGGIFANQSWKEAEEYKTKIIPKAKQGFDLVVARPYRGWSVGEEPPYFAGNNMYPSFGIEVKIMTKLWELVGKNGVLLVQLYEDDMVNFPMLKKYQQMLFDAGFSIMDVKIDRGVIRINKTDLSPKKLPI